MSLHLVQMSVAVCLYSTLMAGHLGRETGSKGSHFKGYITRSNTRGLLCYLYFFLSLTFHFAPALVVPPTQLLIFAR